MAAAGPAPVAGPVAVAPAATLARRTGDLASQGAPGLGPMTFTPTGPGGFDTIDAVFMQDPTACPANQPQPLIAAYPGTLEVGREPNGSLYLISQLTFSQYLKGIAEVPPSWPQAALQAQVVAARTYALSHMNGPTIDGLSYNLCSTDACQVYRGLGVEKGPYGQNWAQAVDSTAGQILEYQGKPIDAFYFSTSDGHTYSNAAVFGGTPLPYLQPVVENDDTQSPTSSWSVTMPLGDLAQTLSLAGRWAGGAITTVTQQGGTIAVSGPAQSASMSIDAFRNALNLEAVCLQPRRYPTVSGGGHLPQVVPSIWMTLQQQGGSIVMTGRGWGHGVGMVQWGAEGKAARGLDYRQILAYYYGGLQPVTVAEPGSIRVLVAAGVQEVTVAPSGPVQVSGGPGGSGAGPVTITGGPTMTIAPAATLASGGVIPPTVAITNVTSTRSASTGSPAVVSLDLNHAANVGLTYQLQGATTTAEVAPVPLGAGAQSLKWDAVAAGVPPGNYNAAVVADDGVSRVVSSPLRISVLAPPPPSPAKATPRASPRRGSGHGAGVAAGRAPSPGGMPTGVLVVAGVAFAAGLAAAFGATLRIRRKVL